MIRRREVGWTSLFQKGTGNRVDVARAELERVEAAFQRGEAFIRVLDIYGDRMTIRLGDFCMVAECTPAGYAAWRADDRAERADDKADDLVDGG